jgi:hypothetical protein
MNPQEIKSKIENLDWWLTNHPNDPNYSQVLQDKQNLQKQLKELEENG